MGKKTIPTPNQYFGGKEELPNTIPTFDEYQKSLKKKEISGEESFQESKIQDQDSQLLGEGFRTVAEKFEKSEKEYVEDITEIAEPFRMERPEVEQLEKERKEIKQEQIKSMYDQLKPQLEVTRSELQNRKDSLQEELNYTQTTLKELQMSGQLDINNPEIQQLTIDSQNLPEQVQQADLGLRNLKHTEDFIDDLDKILSGENQKFSEGVYQNVLKKISFEGIKSIQRNFDLKNIADKIEKGESITEDENIALASYGLLQEAQQNFPSGIGYEVGSGLIEMIPYLASFAISGGISKGIQGSITKALKTTGEKTIKNFLKKGISYIGGQIPRGLFFPSLYEQAGEKQIGIIQPKETKEGIKAEIIPETREKAGKAWIKAYANTMSEVMTEQLGEAVNPIITKMIGKGINLPINKNIPSKIKDAIGFHGFVSEMGEEFANEILQTAIEGRPAEEIFDPRKILVTGLTIGIMSGGMAIANTPYRNAITKEKINYGKKIEAKLKKGIDDILEADYDVTQKAKDLEYIIDEKSKSGYTKDQVRDLINYIQYKNTDFAIDNIGDNLTTGIPEKVIGEEKQKVEEKVKPEEKVVTEPKKQPEIKEKKEEVKPTIDIDKLNPEQQEQYQEMINQYGKERADELITTFLPETEKYIYTPEEYQQKIKEETKHAERDKGTQVRTESTETGKEQTISDKDLPEFDRTELSDREKAEYAKKEKIKFTDLESQLIDIDDSIQKMKEENPDEFKKDGTPKARSKILPSFKALIDNRSSIIEEMQGLKEEEFVSRAREESEKSRIETEKISKAFEERQKELEKYIPEEELIEERNLDKVNDIMNKVSSGEKVTQEEINFVNENAWLPKGFEFTETGLKKISKKEIPKAEIEPEISKNLRNIANKIRQGKISKLKGFKVATGFDAAWDGALETLATTLELTADLTTSINKALEYIKNTDWYKNLKKEKQTEFDNKFISHIDNELSKEYADATKHKFINKDIEERFEQAIVKEESITSKLKDFFITMKNKINRTYQYLPKNKKFAEAYNAINTFQKAINISSGKAGDAIKNILKGLSKSEYSLFTKKIIFDDLLETIKLNPEYELPFGLTKKTLREELNNINKYVAYNSKIKDAINRRKDIYKNIQDEYIKYAKKLGLETKGLFDRNEYFRHQVLLYSEATKKERGKPLQRPKGLSLFKARLQGKGYDINRNYIEAEFEVFSKLEYAIEKMKMIDNIYRNYDIIKDLRQKAKEKLGEEASQSEINKWIENNIPEGYIIDSPENMNIFMANSIPESILKDLLEGKVEELGIKKDDIRKIFALGASKKIVIPIEIYKTFDSISKFKHEDRFSKFDRNILNAWKVWTLIQPKRFFKYNFRNLSGDAEAVFLGNKKVFTKVPQAVKELFDVYISHKLPSDLMQEYIDRGGLQLTLTTQEISDLKKIKEFRKYYDKKESIPKRIWDKYWRLAKLSTDFREQLLRYAAFIEYVNEINSNKGKVKNYGASNPSFIDGLANNFDKAFRLSNELLGAYDQLGEFGQNVRKYWIPFWSFQEVNVRRYNQLFMNALNQSESLSGKTLKGFEFAAKKIPYTAWKMTKLALKLTGFWGMTSIWNNLLFGDEEDELPEDIKGRPHIIFGRNKDGTIKYVSRLGVLGDYLEWFGLDTFPVLINDFMSGRRNAKEIAKEMYTAPANKIVNGINPYIKTTAELIFGKSLFPDITRPRIIRDNWDQISINLGIKDEYRAISKLPNKPYYKSLRKLFFDEIDPLASSYWAVVSAKYQFKEKKGKSSKGSYSLSDKSIALYYHKEALVFGDIESAKYYLQQYIMLGGTERGYNQSLKYLNPLYGVKEEELTEFKEFLGDKGRKDLEKAGKYYEKVLNTSMSGIPVEEYFETETEDIYE